jgi:hypothetical protein
MLSRGTLCTPTSTTMREGVPETRGLLVRKSQLSLHEMISAVGAALLQEAWEAPRRGMFGWVRRLVASMK